MNKELHLIITLLLILLGGMIFLNGLTTPEFEVVSSHSSEADRAADIVDQLPPDKRDLAVRLLEQLLA